MNWATWILSLAVILTGPLVVFMFLRVGYAAVAGKLRPTRGRLRGIVDLMLAALYSYGIVVLVIHFPWMWPFHR
jgi:hypothetical protein